MNGEKISRCLDAVPDTMLDEAMVPYRPRTAKQHMIKIAAIAAVLVLVITALLWPGNGEATPYFFVYVYADAENNTEPLTNQAQSAVSNIITNDAWNPAFGQTTPAEPRFGVGVEFNSLTENYKNFKVFCNGEEVTQRGNGITVAYVLNTENGKHTGLYIMGVVEESSRISLVLYDDDESVLQRYTMDVNPSEEGYILELVENYICPPNR